MRTGIFSLLLLSLLTGCGTQSQQVSVRSGDCLSIVCTTRQSREIRQVVDPAGDISLPLIGKLHVADMTLREIGESVGRAYHPSWPPEPEFSVSLCR
jgi:protein involved in polysaccharide export with SLBB domain